MEKRETSKIFEFGDRTWHIGKFNAWVGSYIAYKLMAEALPMGIGKQAGVPTPKGSKQMNRADFTELQKDCLGVCSEQLPGGLVPVLNSEGNFAVVGLEHDTKTVLALTIQALVFNVADFFDASLWGSIAADFQGLNMPSAKI